MGRSRVPPDGGEIAGALAPLENLPLAGAVLTGDAAFCQRAICQTIRDRDGASPFAVKADRPELWPRSPRPPATLFPPI